MKRLAIALLAVTGLVSLGQIASAADLPIKTPVYKAPAAAPAYNWTGFYIGANVGGGWGNNTINYAPNDPPTLGIFLASIGGPPPPTSFNLSGVIGGLQLGYNYQFNRNWLIGLEADFDWSGIKGSGTNSFAVPTGPLTLYAEEKIKWFSTVRARVGYLPVENFLVYVTGGLAYGEVERNASLFNAGSGFAVQVGNGFTCSLSTTCFSGSSSDTAAGWTVGGGLEYALLDNLTVKAEYLYVSLGSKSLTEMATTPFGPGVSLASLNAAYDRTNFNVARVGLNYRF